MRYEIINDKNVVEASVVRQLDALLAQQADRLDKYVKAYRKPLVLEVHSKKPGPNTYLITLLLDLRSKPLVVKNKDADPVRAFSKGFNALRHKLTQQLQVERRQHQRYRKGILQARVEEVVEPLLSFKEEQDPAMFTRLIKKAMPHLIGYLRRRIKQANITHTLRKEAMKAEDLMNELYLRLYNRFDASMASHKQQVYMWLYQEADRLLAEVIDQHGVTALQENIDELQKPFNQEMEEQYSIDADGDYTMMEEFDDPSYGFNDSQFAAGFYDVYTYLSDDQTQEYLDAETEFDLMNEEQQAALHRLMYSLSDFKRSVLDLYAYEHLAIEDIAVIKNVPNEKVEAILAEVKALMQAALLPLQ